MMIFGLNDKNLDQIHLQVSKQQYKVIQPNKAE